MDKAFPILVVEDDPIHRTLLCKRLTEAGHEVICASEGRAVLEMLQNRFFPIVITDWNMPEMDGPALCRAIRAMSLPGYVYIILLTARSDKRDIVEGLKAGADDYLTKPFEQAELMARLATGERILSLERSLKRANEEIRRLSITDPLTGVFNRGYLDAQLPDELARANRYGHPLTLILTDIDHFKAVNDQYGHPAGDDVLRQFVARLRSAMRGSVDWVARFGGEEFVLILPETGLEGAGTAAERFRRAIGGAPFVIGSETRTLTASFGVASVESASTAEPIAAVRLIEEADRCLYRAKQEGRDRVVAVRVSS